MQRSCALRTIGLAGLVAGILDICSAIVIWILRGIGLTRGFQGIASGLLGRESFHGGYGTATLGLALHFVVAFGVTTVFYLASRVLPILTRHPILSAFVYGPLVYLVMYWGVVPLSRIGWRPHSVSNDVTAILIHIFLIALPISLIVSRLSPPLPKQIS